MWYAVLAPEHPLALRAAAGNAQLASFLEECRRGGIAEAAVEDGDVPHAGEVAHEGDLRQGVGARLSC